MCILRRQACILITYPCKSSKSSHRIQSLIWSAPTSNSGKRDKCCRSSMGFRNSDLRRESKLRRTATRILTEFSKFRGLGTLVMKMLRAFRSTTITDTLSAHPLSKASFERYAAASCVAGSAPIPKAFIVSSIPKKYLPVS